MSGRGKSRVKKSGQKGGQKITFEQKIAKLAIADFWAKDEDGTGYYINVAVFNDQVMVRFRIDIPGEEPIILALPVKLAYQIGTALQRAAFAAKVLTSDEVKRLWAMARGKADKAGEETSGSEEENGNKVNETKEIGKEESVAEEEDVFDISFA